MNEGQNSNGGGAAGGSASGGGGAGGFDTLMNGGGASVGMSVNGGVPASSANTLTNGASASVSGANMMANGGDVPAKQLVVNGVPISGVVSAPKVSSVPNRPINPTIGTVSGVPMGTVGGVTSMGYAGPAGVNVGGGMGYAGPAGGNTGGGMGYAGPATQVSSGTEDIVLSSGEEKKSRKGVLIAVVIVVMLILGVGIFALMQGGLFSLGGSNVVDSKTEMTREDLASAMADINYDLLLLINYYNDTLKRNEQDVSDSSLIAYSETFIDEMEDKIQKVQDEIDSLPDAENSGLSFNEKEEYDEVKDEYRKQLGIIRGGWGLARRIHEAFFWPVVDIWGGAAMSSSSARIDELINDENEKVSLFGKAIRPLYASVAAKEDQANTLEGLMGVEVIKQYYDCFESINDIDGLKEKIQGFVMEIKE